MIHATATAHLAMSNPETIAQIQVLLRSADSGDKRAAESLLPLLYDELRAVAAKQLHRESPGQTLQPTALVHEAYLRIVGESDPGWENSRHFFVAAAEAMRRIMIERARRKSRVRHGGELKRVAFDAIEPEIQPPSTDVIDLHRAIQKLKTQKPRSAEIALLRCFGGLSSERCAEVMRSSPSTIAREWRFARAWLKQEIAGDVPE